jgi:hypothetical protein
VLAGCWYAILSVFINVISATGFDFKISSSGLLCVISASYCFFYFILEILVLSKKTEEQLRKGINLN